MTHELVYKDPPDLLEDHFPTEKPRQRGESDTSESTEDAV